MMNGETPETPFEAANGNTKANNDDALPDRDLSVAQMGDEELNATSEHLNHSSETNNESLPPSEALFEWYGIHPQGDSDSAVNRN